MEVGKKEEQKKVLKELEAILIITESIKTKLGNTRENEETKGTTLIDTIFCRIDDLKSNLNDIKSEVDKLS